MNGLDLILLILIALALGFALRHVLRGRKKSCCSSCEGCPGCGKEGHRQQHP